MYCSRCGKEVPDSADRCPYCSETVLLVNGPVPAKAEPEVEGVTVSSPQDEVQELQPSVPKQSLWMLILLILITGGIYEAFWYRKAARALNALEGRKKFGKAPFLFFLVAYSVYFLLSMVKGSYQTMGIDTSGVQMISGVLWLTTTSFLIMVCFRMMDTLKAWHEGEGLPFSSSRLYTVILNVFYVQNKMNRM